MGIHEGWDVAVGWRTGLEHESMCIYVYCRKEEEKEE